MSTWRRKASEHLPKYQKLITSTGVDSPMMLWIELNQVFGKECEKEPQNIELLCKFWKYCDECINSPSDDVVTAAVLGFCEHLIDSPSRVKALPKIMKRSEFLDLRSYLLYHNDEQSFLEALKTFE